jgi:predicted MPP superfamily phosphohydrolase
VSWLKADCDHLRRNDRKGIEVTEQPIWLERLPEPFHRFRVVQLSDIHHGLYTPLEVVERAVHLANNLRPDLVCITGDFVSRSRICVEPVAEALGGLSAGRGVFAVLGNHDHRVGAEAVAQALRRRGIVVLRNQNLALGSNGNSFYVAGVDDATSGHDDLPRALKGIPAYATKILLSHHPRILRRAARQGVDFVMAGHTHGGQVDWTLLELLYGQSKVPLRFFAGLDRLGATQMYVSRGIGTILLPIRIGCPAEIPRFCLLPRRGTGRSDHGGKGGENFRSLPHRGTCSPEAGWP